MQYPYDYRLDGFLDALYERFSGGGDDLLSADGERFREIQAKKRRQLASSAGIDRLNDLMVINEPTLLEKTLREGFTQELFGVTIAPGLDMPFYRLTPDKPRLDAGGKPIGMLYCHGHGSGGVGDTLIVREPLGYHKNFPVEMAKRGYTVYMFEPAVFGGFDVTCQRSNGGNGCVPATGRLLLYGITTVGLRVFEARRTAELMRENGIATYGVAGISGGGTMTTVYAALYDDASAVAISGYSNTFKDSILTIHHCIDNYIPGCMDIGELPAITAMAFPKPLLISSGDNDPIFPVDATRKCYEIVRGAYERQGCAGAVSLEIFSGVHEYSLNVIDWLDGVLK